MAEHFDPNSIAVENGNFFGFPCVPDESEIVILSAPWDVTTSYKDGTSRGPRAVLQASYQLDFSSPFRKDAWKTRIGTLPTPSDWYEKNLRLRAMAKSVIHSLGKGESPAKSQNSLAQINSESRDFHAELETTASKWLRAGKKVITLGGDHSVSLGPIRALAAQRRFSILHIDAHADLRVAYEGFEHSHASIMNHVKDVSSVEKIVQVGLRDVAPQEQEVISAGDKITAFFDWDLRRETSKGTPWTEQCKKIVSSLGPEVYLSVDIDGLDPKYCPNTGTPVPGGLEYWEFFALLEEVEKSGRRFLGADLVEVAPATSSDEWDANVGARILFQICQFLRESR